MKQLLALLLVLLVVSSAEARPRRCRGGKGAVPAGGVILGPVEDIPIATPLGGPTVEELPTPTLATPQVDIAACDCHACTCEGCDCEALQAVAAILKRERDAARYALDEGSRCAAVEINSIKAELEESKKKALTLVADLQVMRHEKQATAFALTEEIADLHHGNKLVVCALLIAVLGLAAGLFWAVNRKPKHIHGWAMAAVLLACCTPAHAYPVVIHPVPLPPQPPVNYQAQWVFHPLIFRPWLGRQVLHMVPVPAQQQPQPQPQLQPAPTR